jgi:cell division septation protein DedD
MAESGIREIQLSGKQLAFLFMTTVVLLVGVFLLGVSVGRGARVTAAAPAPPADLVTNPETAMAAPPTQQASPDNLTASVALQGSAAAVAAKPAAPNTQTPSTPAQTPQPLPPPAASHPSDTVAEVKAPPASSTPAKPPAPVTPAPNAAATATPAKPAATTSGWYVQVDSFRSRANADALVAKLKGKGFDAYIVDTPKPLNRVRIGPYPQRAAADSVAAQLKKDGYSSPIVSR